ncbi:MAG: HPr family phosphocarrier protein [Verrucomicrobiota bacterium]|jgi:phosphocarrier protein|nr:HPr family phosphocarrier protein [Verrucomicrobiota bacterium]
MTSSNASTIVREYLIQNDIGIHSRPAAAFVKVANKYKSDVSVVYGDKWADGKSILGLLILEVLTGTSIVVEITGEDAEAAADAIQELIDDEEGMFNTPLKKG